VQTLITQAKAKFAEHETTQDISIQTVIGHAKNQFDALEVQQQAILVESKHKTDEITAALINFSNNVTVKFIDVDAKLAEIAKWATMLNNMAQSDVTSARVLLAEKLGGDRGGDRSASRKTISEF